MGGPEDITAEKLEAKFGPSPGLRTSDSQDATPVGQVGPLLAKSRLDSSLKFVRERRGRGGAKSPSLTQKFTGCTISKRLMHIAIRKGIAQPVGTAEGPMIHNRVERPETPLIFYELKVTR